jgi:hypothetical protein
MDGGRNARQIDTGLAPVVPVERHVFDGIEKDLSEPDRVHGRRSLSGKKIGRRAQARRFDKTWTRRRGRPPLTCASDVSPSRKVYPHS